MRTLVIMILMLLTSYFGSAQTYIGDKEEINKILKNLESFSNYVMNSEYDLIGNSYTKDAKIFPNNTKIIEGKTAIVEYWTLPEGVRTVHHKIMPDEIQIVEDTAYDYGYYEGATLKANGKKTTWKGKYVIVWKKQADTWKIYLDIWNSVK
ncbi:YybH family protein [Aquimarina celericrescens]|uniref:YybH family protein n=1 Tax=Aquimarina celericrescens TaxID=1964542 RepID=A0ABW5B3U4_9FLAO|nr:DUF4440 domain-containing protein [Aquimarina celericrescens]